MDPGVRREDSPYPVRFVILAKAGIHEIPVLERPSSFRRNGIHDLPLRSFFLRALIEARDVDDDALVRAAADTFLLVSCSKS
jgi:hypothetical protein